VEAQNLVQKIGKENISIFVIAYAAGVNKYGKKGMARKAAAGMRKARKNK
jgi:hypothetical protein